MFIKKRQQQFGKIHYQIIPLPPLLKLHKYAKRPKKPYNKDKYSKLSARMSQSIYPNPFHLNIIKTLQKAQKTSILP